ncbi:enoyl-CoA hydratase/isomerase family protein [Ferrovibrio sp.]|uniref:enoyl-CoA hydratase/isomerase family protein n=1 Tax=Ferrovibrio sp. TaxID=1917215 RepID=UPI001B7B6DA8|nr:enoyl-CoA hydratase/isomerase family protein [Ferrovibrio sp.]MBP7065951.1 enoyl-CoA hydratase/isomerase family protein [Ferrovibrio sp.]
MSLVRLDQAGGVARLTLARPDRHNSLVPALLTDLLRQIDAVAAQPGLAAVVLQAEGRSFSTGGDVRGFHAVAQGERRAYAAALVGDLNRAILALYDLPCPLLGRLQGPLTGGALGLLLACDLVVAAPQVFLQPYYVDVGFSPDGGWCALLPGRIGEAAAREIQLLNRRVAAEEMLRLGLVQAVTSDLDGTLEAWLNALNSKQANAVACTKRQLLPPQRRNAMAAALEAERQSFIEQIDSEATQAGMARFLAKSA